MIDIYAGEERKVEILEEASAWAAAGIVTSEQLSAIEGLNRPRLTRVNWFFRLLLGVFTLVALGAAVALAGLVLNPRETAAGVLLILASVPLAVAADRWLITGKRLYRCGAEEAALAAAVGFAAVGVGILLHRTAPTSTTIGLVVRLVILAAASAAAVRYGNPWAALAAIVTLAGVPFDLRPLGWTAARALLAVLTAPAAFWSHRLLSLERQGRAPLLPGYRRCLEVVRGASLAILYLDGNSYVDAHPTFGVLLRAQSAASGPVWRTWLCALLTAALPVLGLWIGVRRRDRALLWFGGLSAVASLLTLKYFFHLGYLAQEITAAGAALATSGFLLTRWLRAGPAGERGGFAADRILDPKLYGFDLEAVAALQPLNVPQPPPPPGFQPGGGGFGGGGASGRFG